MDQSEISSFFREYKLDYPAIEYVKGNVQRYGLAFGNRLCQKVDFASGEVTTYAPNNINALEKNRLERFDHGHLLSSLPSSAKEILFREKIEADFDLWLSPIVQNHLESSRNAVCVFTDIDVKPVHLVTMQSFMHVSIFEDEVYFLLTNEHSTAQDIDIAFCEVGSWSLVCALTLYPEVDRLTKESHLTLEELDIFANNIQKIIIMAYDGEGYLVWNKV